MSRRIYPLLLIAPALALLAAVSIYPTLYSLWLSTQRFRRGVPEFVGLRNYVTILTGKNFWESLQATLIFGVSFVLITVSVAFLLALVFNRRPRGAGFYMTIIFLPWMLSEIVSGVMFRWMFLPQFGVLQNWLGPLVGENFRFLSTPGGAMGVVTGATVWRSLAFAMLLILAGLQTLPREISEAAAIDGASRWQSFWHVVWPLVLPTTTVTVLLLTIQAVNAAGMFLAITNGGPGRSTEVLSLYMYREAIEFFNIGYGAALSVIMLGMNGLLAAVYLRTLRREALN
ncbi:MAG: sugar ABC transporter permease [Chloroflexi bacterium]|nr:sugar ABC transporter permease [Chloroflexota bacterium]